MARIAKGKLKALEDRIQQLENLLKQADPIEWLRKDDITSAYNWYKGKERVLKEKD